MSNARGVNVKNITSQEYENRLNDIATATYYDRMLPVYEANPIKETYAGSHAIGTDPVMDGWHMLGAAIIAQSLLDWFDLWMGIRDLQNRKDTDLEKRQMRQIEEELRKTSIGETALLQMIMEVRRIENDPWQLDFFRRRLSRSAHTIGRI